MSNVKVKVIKDFKNDWLKQLLPLGFETEIIPTLSIKEKEIFREQTRHDKDGKLQVIVPAVIAPIGDFEGYTFAASNGEIYSDRWLYLYVGYLPIDKIFDKI